MREAAVQKLMATAPDIAPEAPAAPVTPAAPAIDGTKPDPKIGAALSAAMRREAQANAIKVQADKDRKEAAQAQKDAADAIALRAAIKRGDADAIKLLQQENPSLYKLWTEALVGGKAPLPVDPKITDMEARLKAAEEKAKSAEERQQAADNHSAYVQFVGQIKEATVGDEFELFRAIKDSDEIVLNAQSEHWKNTVDPATGKGEMKPWAEYAKALQEEFVESITPMLQTKAMRAIIAEILGANVPQPQPGEIVAPPTPDAIAPMRTVTNNEASAAPAATAANTRETRAQIVARLRKEAAKADAQ